MSALYVAAGIAACLVVLRVAARRDPHKRLRLCYVLGALAGAAVGFLTHEQFSIRFAFPTDAAGLSALLGGLGAARYAIMPVATERPPKAKPDRERDARFIREPRRAASGEEG
jgi:hypothetical protein